MTDARVPRRAQVVLLDDRKLDFLIQPRLFSRELLDMVASHFNLHEKEYFGLYHADDIGNENWLSLDRKVLEHDLPRYADPIVFYFAVRFYVPSITYFREKVTVELFYLQAKTLIFKIQLFLNQSELYRRAEQIKRVKKLLKDNCSSVWGFSRADYEQLAPAKHPQLYKVQTLSVLRREAEIVRRSQNLIK